MFMTGNKDYYFLSWRNQKLLNLWVHCLFQAMNSLELLARVTERSVTEIMEPHKEVLQDMIPPKKHLLRHQPVNAQIGLMVSQTATQVVVVTYLQIFICLHL